MSPTKRLGVDLTIDQTENIDWKHCKDIKIKKFFFNKSADLSKTTKTKFL